MAAGIAGGVLGGFVLGEVAEEVFDGDDSDDFDSATDRHQPASSGGVP